jgi:hypothetical protein
MLAGLDEPVRRYFSVGWWFESPRYAPFFHVEIGAVTRTR